MTQPINFDIAQINVHRYSLHNLYQQGAYNCPGWLLTFYRRFVRKRHSKCKSLTILILTPFVICATTQFTGHSRGRIPKTMGETLIAIANRAALATSSGSFEQVSRFVTGKTAFVLTAFGVAVATRYRSRECRRPTTRSRGRTASGVPKLHVRRCSPNCRSYVPSPDLATALPLTPARVALQRQQLPDPAGRPVRALGLASSGPTAGARACPAPTKIRMGDAERREPGGRDGPAAALSLSRAAAWIER